jgi:PPK2 family polyphosphate:nucleotide phosphotransferase
MPIETSKFRVHPGQSVDVTKLPTLLPPAYEDKKDYKKQLQKDVEKLAAIQHKLYAENRQSLLVVLQAMDTGGKDGLIRHVLSGVNPQGCRVYSFGKPSTNELQHDFLWRTTLVLPERGDIGVFNRSYYEEVLVVRVHPAILEGQNLPDDLAHKKSIWDGRFRSIRDYEKHLEANGTRVLKLFLHISKAEQERRLLSRIDDETKNWKFNAADLDERQAWDDYMKAYSEAISETSTSEVPWYVLPGDDKRNARLYAARIILDTLEDMNPRYPEVTHQQHEALEQSRIELLGSTTTPK